MKLNSGTSISHITRRKMSTSSTLATHVTPTATFQESDEGIIEYLYGNIRALVQIYNREIACVCIEFIVQGDSKRCSYHPDTTIPSPLYGRDSYKYTQACMKSQY